MERFVASFVIAIYRSKMHKSWKRTAIKTATDNRTKAAANWAKNTAD